MAFIPAPRGREEKATRCCNRLLIFPLRYCPEGKNLVLGVLEFLRLLLGEGEDQTGDHEDAVETAHADQLPLEEVNLGVATTRVHLPKLDEELEQFDRGDRDNGSDDLLLEPAIVDLAHPGRTVDMVPRDIDLGDEVFVSAEDDHDDQVAHQHHVHELKDGNDDAVGIRRQACAHDMPELLGKLAEDDQKRRDEAVVHRRQDPSASEEQFFHSVQKVQHWFSWLIGVGLRASPPEGRPTWRVIPPPHPKVDVKVIHLLPFTFPMFRMDC